MTQQLFYVARGDVWVREYPCENARATPLDPVFEFHTRYGTFPLTRDDAMALREVLGIALEQVK